MMEPMERLTVVLTAQQWDAVLNTMADAHAPYRVTAPLIEEIRRQCMQGAADSEVASADARGNGVLEAEG
jgi:hypothetical protein